MGFLLAGLTVVAVLAVAATLFVQQRRRSGEEYRSAHRLLTRLQSISRQLPAGLDEVALAQQTLEQIAKDVGARRSVLFLNQDDRFVPYAVAGSDRSPFDALPDVVVEAAREGRPLAGRDLISEAALQEATVPLTLGMRLVGIVALQSDQPFDYALLKQSVERGHDAALRIDSGRLFSDVRQAATVEERRRLAREIHDGVAQELASVGYALDALVSDLDGSQDRALADEIRSDLARTVPWPADPEASAGLSAIELDCPLWKSAPAIAAAAAPAANPLAAAASGGIDAAWLSPPTGAMVPTGIGPPIGKSDTDSSESASELPESMVGLIGSGRG